MAHFSFGTHMKSPIQKPAAWFFYFLKLAPAFSLGLSLGLLCATSGWFYGYHNDHIMRCFSVRLPGIEEYTEWNYGPPRIASRFSMGVRYRIGPWIEPEWIETPPVEAEAE